MRAVSGTFVHPPATIILYVGGCENFFDTVSEIASEWVGCALFITDSLRTQVDRFLRAIEERSRWLAGLTPSSGADDPGRVWAAERALHVAVECVTDAANLIIDALVMRDPGGYVDIVRVLMEEGVVSRDWFQRFEPMLRLRERLVHGYLDLPPDEIMEAAVQFGPLFNEYVASVRQYLGIKDLTPPQG